jgi:hypothetical protein
VANVSADEFCFRTGGAKLGGQGFAGVIATAGNDDTGAFLRESESGGAANAGQGTGDQDDGFAHGDFSLKLGIGFFAYMRTQRQDPAWL